jgi:ferredoxin
MFAADERCTACGSCARDCPAGAIVMAGTGPARRPRWGWQCEGCNRCINLCPREAVQASPIRSAVHTFLNAALIAAVVVGLNRAAVALSVPGLAGVIAYAAALIALVVVGSRLQFAGLERPLFALESIPAVRRTIGHSWTARFPRYQCPGFQPARDGRAPLS